MKNASGTGISGLGARSTAAVPALLNFRFGIAKLVPSTNGTPSKWVNYIVTTSATPPVATLPTADREGTLVDHGAGSYTYTFYRDLAKIKDTAGVTDVTYDGTLTHRLVLTVTLGTDPTSGKFPKSVNVIKEFTIDPTTKAAIDLTATSTRRDITTTAKCNSCHIDISKWSSGSENDGGHFDTRPDVRNCISCHNDQLRIGSKSAVSTAGAFPVLTAAQKLDRRNTPRILDGEVMFDMPVMIHKIHFGSTTNLAGGLKKTNVWSDGLDFNAMKYPQEVINCRKCHSGDTAAELAAAPQGNNWKTAPSRLACGSCHDYIKWSDGTDYRGAGFPGHPGIGGARTDDSQCTICHSATYIETKHTSINNTPNNPSVPVGATNFTYELSSVTVGTGADLGKPIVKFRIMAVTPPATTATPVTFVKSVGGSAPLTGFTGAPSFLVAFADGANSTVDFNNTGNALAGATVSGAQPTSISISKLCDTSVTTTATVGTSGTMIGPDASGYYIATLNQAAAGTAGASVFPVSAKLRTVALQGYFTQVTPALARHAVMKTKSVSGEDRRLVVDSDKCAQCHEYFEGHGGNRNYNMDGCVVCHNPNLSSSGRTRIAGLGVPEATQNQKDMIHGIHAAGFRTNKYIHTRGKASGTLDYTLYDWSGVVYPAKLNNCLVCHKPGTYGSVPSGAIATTNVTTTLAATWAAATGVVTSADTAATVIAARLNVNPNDLVITPYSAACVSCHDSDASKAHMETNGGKVNKKRSDVVTGSEACATCHGAGKVYGVDAVHQ
ncbi:MAG: OmcA/MtrC family decaheme c-type cytochrome [Syntrophales bacterium]